MMTIRPYCSSIIAIMIISILFLNLIALPNTGSFSLNIKINDDETNAQKFFPDISIDGSNTIHTTWFDYREKDKGLGVYYANSKDDGLSFSTNVRVGDAVLDEAAEIFLTGPSISAADESNIYISYYSVKNGNYDIYFTKSEDGGNSFEVRSSISGSTGYSQVSVDIEAIGLNRVYAVWMDFNAELEDSKIIFSSSSDSAYTFNKDVIISGDSNITVYPRMALDTQDNIHVVWQDGRGGDFDVYYTVSTDDGTSFTTSKMIAGGFKTNQTEPSIAVGSDGTIYVTYTDDSSGYSDIYFTKSSDAGKSWTEGVMVNEDSEFTIQSQSHVAVDSEGQIYVIWSDNRSNPYSRVFDIYTANSTDAGKTFSTNEMVNNHEQASPYAYVINSNWVNIAMNSEDVGFVIWADNRDAFYNIYLGSVPIFGFGDDIPPIIEHSPVTSGTNARDIEVKAKITDNLDAVTATVYFRTTGESEFKKVSMKGKNDIYTANIPSTSVKPEGVEYYIEASDIFNIVTHPAVNPLISPHKIKITTLNPPAVFDLEPGVGEITLLWNEVKTATGYNLYRSTSSIGEFNKMNVQPISVQTYKDTTVEEDITYFYYIKSVDSEGLESLKSETKSAMPLKEDKDDDPGSGQDMLLWIIITAVVIIAIIGIFLFQRYRKKKK